MNTNVNYETQLNYKVLVVNTQLSTNKPGHRMNKRPPLVPVSPLLSGVFRNPRRHALGFDATTGGATPACN